MKKPATLRAALAAALPEFAGDETRMRIWVEDGSAQSRLTGSLAFGFSYRLNLLLVETKSDIALVALPVFRWLQVNQPALLTPGNDGFTFDVDVLDNETADILIQLQLDEMVTVAPLEDGGFALNYLPEPDPLFDDFSAPADLPEVPPLSAVTTAAAQ